jgi:hypothetical protein
VTAVPTIPEEPEIKIRIWFLCRRASIFHHTRRLHSGYSEHTGTSSRAAIFIGDTIRDGGILRGIFASFKYFAWNDGAEESRVTLESGCDMMQQVDY